MLYIISLLHISYELYYDAADGVGKLFYRAYPDEVPPVDAAGGGQVRVRAGEDAHDLDALAPELFHLLGGGYDAGLPAVAHLPAHDPHRYHPVIIGAGDGE